MLRALVLLILLGVSLVLYDERLAPVAGALFIIGICALWVWREGNLADESGMRSPAQALAERQRAMEDDLSEVRERGRPYRA